MDIIPFSYLEFGSVDPKDGSRRLYDYKTHEKAYEWLMHGRYSNDIVAYRGMVAALETDSFDKLKSIFINQIHHKNDIVVNLNKLIALEIAGNSFFELGQTLFGCIDAMEFVRAFSSKCLNVSSNVSLRDVIWQGVDISDFFNELAGLMHSGYNVSVGSELGENFSPVDVFFAKGITLLYAIDSVEKLINLVNSSKLAVFDFSFSLGSSVSTQIGTGKPVKYLGIDEFHVFYKSIISSGKDIWVRNTSGEKEQGLFYFEGIVANDASANLFVEKQTHWKNSLVKSADDLCLLAPDLSDQYWTWSRLSDHLKLIG